MAKRATNPVKSAGITGGQITKIHALTGAMKLDDGVYRTILSTRFRVESSKGLNYFQAENLIQDLEAKAISAGVWEKRTESKKFEEWGRRQGGMASAPQLRKIEAMWKDVSRAETPEERKKGLRSFLERIAKVSDLRFLDMDGAGKIITALVAIQRRQEKSAPSEKEGLCQL